MRETCNTCSKCSANISIDKSKFCSFIIVFIMHIVNCIQSIYIQISKPFKHNIILSHYFIIIKIFRSDWLQFWSYLCIRSKSSTFIFTTIDSVKQSFCKVSTSSEELHFFTSLSCRYTTADRIVITPNWAHYIIIFILDRRCID